jgi:benzoate 4-monooxygenase
VPAYSMHHSIAIWGMDADDFCPERWETVSEK